MIDWRGFEAHDATKISVAGCWFSGGVYGKAKHLRYDGRTYTDDATGIRYRWLFLAKSHVARKQSSISETVSDSFGCVFCDEEGKETAIYDSPASLMGHISMEHRGLGDEIAANNKCVMGQGVPTEWEICIS